MQPNVLDICHGDYSGMFHAAGSLPSNHELAHGHGGILISYSMSR